MVPVANNVDPSMWGLWVRNGQTFGVEFEFLCNREIANEVRIRLEDNLPAGTVADAVEYEPNSKDHRVWNVAPDEDGILEVTSRVLEGRIQITAMWYDRFGRITDTVRYGTNGGSNFDRDGLSVPARSDTALLTEYPRGVDAHLPRWGDQWRQY